MDFGFGRRSQRHAIEVNARAEGGEFDTLDLQIDTVLGECPSNLIENPLLNRAASQHDVKNGVKAAQSYQHG